MSGASHNPNFQQKNHTEVKTYYKNQKNERQKNTTIAKKLPQNSKNITIDKNYHNKATKLKIYHKIQKNTVVKHRNIYDCNTNHPERLSYTFVRVSVKNFDLTFRFLRVKAKKIRFLGVKSRNLRRKIRFWLWVLRRKHQISWGKKI